MRQVRSRWRRDAQRSAAATVLSVGIFWSGSAARADRSVEVVRFETADGVEIVGDYFAPRSDASPAPGIILVHMLREDRASWKPLIPELHKAGLAVLAIDLRGHGDSGSPRLEELRRRVRDQDVGVFHEMDRDVEAAVVWMISRPDVDKSRLGLIGATVGFSAALKYAVRDPSIDVMVGLTPGAGFVGMDSNSGAMLYGKRPMLLLAVETDSRAVETISKMNPNVVGDIVGTGTGHGTRMLTRYEEVPGRIATFVASHVGKASTTPVVFELGDRQFYKSVEALRAGKSDVAAKRIRWCSSAEEAGERGLTAVP